MLLTEINKDLLKQNYVDHNRRLSVLFSVLCSLLCLVSQRLVLGIACVELSSCARYRLCRTLGYQLLIAPLVFYNVYYLYVTLTLF